MPEVEECRYCARCCEDCIFLEYDKTKKIFSCLIYNNKYRIPIQFRDWFSNEDFLTYFMNKIEDIINAENFRIEARQICYNYVCTSLEKNNKLENDIRKKKKLSWVQMKYLHNIRNARSLIPNFEDLIEILNS